MNERKACEHLKQRFEQAGFRMAESVDFAAHGLRFELDGFDAAANVGYEYIAAEAGDGWDVDDEVIAKLASLRQRGELSVLVVDETDVKNEADLDRAVDAFIAELKDRGATSDSATPATSSARLPTPRAARKPRRH